MHRLPVHTAHLPPLQAQPWGPLLVHLMQQRHAQPFAWGTADCVTWVADVLLAMHGRDPIADLRGRYTTARQARHLIRSQGARTLAALMCRRLQPIPDGERPGDVALGPRRRGDPIGALSVLCNRWLIAQGMAGLVVIEPDPGMRWFRWGAA